MRTDSKRFFLEIAYHGGAYHGWQVQPNAVTVQQVLEEALQTVLKHAVQTVGCGRTDTGVHARQFYVHFDTSAKVAVSDRAQFVYQLNALLPQDISVLDALPVAGDAHARFDAVSRSYEYLIHFRKDPFLSGLSWRQRAVPDVKAMDIATAFLSDYTDFSCFSKSNTQVFTNNCQIIHAGWHWLNEQQLVFSITADRFLRNMVRAIVGTLMEVGSGKITPGDVRSVIESKNRCNAGMSVPACGLYLTKVTYPYIDVLSVPLVRRESNNYE